MSILTVIPIESPIRFINEISFCLTRYLKPILMLYQIMSFIKFQSNHQPANITSIRFSD